jgi:hypothetical protein
MMHLVYVCVLTGIVDVRMGSGLDEVPRVHSLKITQLNG